jgi:hypothetical protein
MPAYLGHEAYLDVTVSVDGLQLAVFDLLYPHSHASATTLGFWAQNLLVQIEQALGLFFFVMASPSQYGQW